MSLEQKGLFSSEDDGSTPNEDEKNVVFLKDNEGNVHKVKCDDVVYVEAMENYVSIRTTKQSIMVHTTMKKIVEVLPNDIVKRIHRSFCAGLRFISRVSKDSVTVEGGTEQRTLPVSRTYMGEMKKFMGSPND